jgi:hypothetical protein
MYVLYLNYYVDTKTTTDSYIIIQANSGASLIDLFTANLCSAFLVFLMNQQTMQRGVVTYVELRRSWDILH